LTGKVLDLDKLITEDQLGSRISAFWVDWDMRRQAKKTQWDELRSYVYATDTRQTSNSKLPWKNTTTIPKLCQIRDNLFANYLASMFPKRKWLIWEGDDKASNSKDKKEAITSYMAYTIDQDRFKKEVGKLTQDYIDYGNCFGTVEWIDETQTLDDKIQVGYVGPAVRRISPLDIVMNPTAPTFEQSPKIVRSLISIGEVKEMLQRMSNDESKEQYEALWTYLKDIRVNAANYTSWSEKSKNDYYRIDGFTSYTSYLTSGFCELLTFYGDLYDIQTETFYKNHVIVVVDRHKIIWKAPNPSYFGYPPIFHCGWRPRQDNLWAMGPLDNLVGMQYRIDHVENLKADVFDLIAFPPIKIKGYVEDFNWGPMERIYVGDDGDVEMMAPPFQVLQYNQEIESLEARMEEMAGSPKEAMGFRTPGEKTAYEVQRLENAASRIFTNKISQFEEQLVERLLNAMLELGKRNLSPNSTIRVFDDEFKITTFTELSADDITGSGRIRPVAARHFAEKAERVQNLNNFFNSHLGADPMVLQHISSVKLAQVMEDLLEMQEYELVQPYIRLSEQADAQRLQNSHQEQVAMESQTPSGLSPDDHDPDLVGQGASNSQSPHSVDQAPQGPN
jgi:hypothetical protein